MTPVTAIFEEVVEHPGHPLRVEIALELSGEAELAECESPVCSIKAGPDRVATKIMALAEAGQVCLDSGDGSLDRVIGSANRRRGAHRRTRALGATVAVTTFASSSSAFGFQALSG